ncbi:CorA family divalent cation transporter [Panacibacter ginsenosidivorans]|nr:CorA family divalent cation transporter [Panacibacter ginsenosidivorans]
MRDQEAVDFRGHQWIDVQDPSVEEMQALSTKYKLDDHLVRDCMEPDHLPKYDFVDNVHFLILRFYAPEARKSNTTIQELTNKIAIFFTESFVITIHKSACDFLEVLKHKFIHTPSCSSVAALIIKIAWYALESFDDPAYKLSEHIDVYEKELLLKKTVSDHMQHLYDIKRQASISQKIIMMMLEPINHIGITEQDRPAYQDLKDQHLKMQTLYHQALEDVTNLLNLSMSISSHKTNEVVKVLTLFSVFFMPLTFIVGVYGMNFQFMPELREKWGYPGVLALMVLVSLVIFIWFRKKKWL